MGIDDANTAVEGVAWMTPRTDDVNTAVEAVVWTSNSKMSSRMNVHYFLAHSRATFSFIGPSSDLLFLSIKRYTSLFKSFGTGVDTPRCKEIVFTYHSFYFVK